MIYIKAYTRLNLGDDLLIKLVCDNNKYEQFCILASKEYVEVFKDTKNIKVMYEEYELLQSFKSNYEKYLEEQNKIITNISSYCDTFLYVGGSIFIEGGPTSVVRVRQLKNEIKSFKNAYIIGANFGPHTTEEYFNCVHDEIIPLLKSITFRDKYSYELFKDLNNVYYAPDIVFSLKAKEEIKKKKEIGISLINQIKIEDKYKNKYNDYLTYIANIIKSYIKDRYNIRILSFCSYEKDDIAINDILNILSNEDKKFITIDYYNGNLEEYINIIASLDTIIATRFHAIVLALKYQCNVIPICYSNKSINLLNDINIKEYISFSNIDELKKIKPYKIDLSIIKTLENESQKHFDYKKTISD